MHSWPTWTLALLVLTVVACREEAPPVQPTPTAEAKRVEPPAAAETNAPAAGAAGTLAEVHKSAQGASKMAEAHAGLAMGGHGGAAPSGKFSFMGVEADTPEGWVAEKPMSRMRLGQYRLEKAEGDARDAEVTVIGAGGTVEANVTRWRGQFQDSPPAQTEPREVGGLKVTLVRIEGTYLHKDTPMGPGPATPMEGYVMRGIVVQAPGGQLFVKGWGPKATMERWEPSFIKLVESMRKTAM